MEQLTYTKYRKSDNIIIIDLHNGYSIVAIKMWDKEKEQYEVEYRLQENTIDKWELLFADTDIEFKYKATFKTINSAILKEVANLLKDGTLDKYIESYEYELDCYTKGIEVLEVERGYAS